MTTNNELFRTLENLQKQGLRVTLPENATLQAIKRLSETTQCTEHDAEIEQRALGTNNYLVTYENEVANGDMDSDLTSWTEDIDAGITATTAHHTTQGEVFAEQGAIGGLEVEVTASANTGQASRKQVTITAAAAEIWNFQMWVKGSTYTNAEAQLRIIWSGGASGTATSTDVSGDFVEVKLENQVAPGGTTSVDVYQEIDVTTTGGTGKAWFAKLRAEKGATTITDRARRGITGESICKT